MAKAASGSASKPASGAGGAAGIWLIGLACGALIGLATPYALVLGVFLAPALLLLAVDASDGRAAGWAILMIAAASAVGRVMSLWQAGHHMGAALDLVGDFRALATAWAFQGLGWLAVEIGPAIIRLVLDGTAHARALRLRQARARLEEEWGVPAAPPDHSQLPDGGR